MAIKNWLKWEFSSGSITGEDFKRFASDFKKEIKRRLPVGAKLVQWNVGHYYISGFIKNEDNKYVYFSISDVRYFRNDWYNNILVRTAKDENDYTGGSNNFTSLENFTQKVAELLNR